MGDDVLDEGKNLLPHAHMHSTTAAVSCVYSTRFYCIQLCIQYKAFNSSRAVASCYFISEIFRLKSYSRLFGSWCPGSCLRHTLLRRSLLGWQIKRQLLCSLG